MLTGPEFLTTFLYYFVCTALIVLLVASQGMGISLASRFPYLIGMLAGLVAGASGAYFNRSVTFSTPFTGKPKMFEETFVRILLEMGFAPSGQVEDFTIYTKSPFKTLFAGRVFVKTEKDTVTIVTRSSTLKYLQEKLALK